jgi:HK97 family phage portal protein
MDDRPNLLQRIFRSSPENPRTSLSRPASWLLDLFVKSKSGATVNESSSMTLSAVYAAVRVISETVASLPLHVYEREGQGRRRLDEHPVALLLEKPNPYQTSFVWKQFLQASDSFHGNAYCIIERNAAGQPIKLTPVHPDKVAIKMRDGEKYFHVDKVGVFADYEMLHLMGLSFSGIEGISVMEAAREAIGMGLAAQQFGGEFFGNGANLGGVITHPAKLTPDSMQRLKDSWRRNYQGNDKSHGTAVLEEGMKYERIGIPPDQAQFLETRKFQILDIARIFRVPPHMLGELDASASRANIEEQGISFVRDTIRPIVTMWEDELNKKLFMPSEQGRMYVRFNLDSLLRGDTSSRFSSYAVARQWGWLSVNDIRDLENMNPIEGGDVYLQPLNMVNAATQPNDVPID